MMLSNAPLSQRLGLGIVLILLVASALNGMLNVLKFQKLMENREAAIYQFVVGNLRGAIEDSASLGLPLSVLHNTQVMLDRRRSEDRTILRILVFDDNRRILFDTERQHIGEALPDGLAPPSANAQGWTMRDSLSSGIGARLVNAFGTTVGGVVLQHDRDPIGARVTAVAFDVTVATLAASTLACIACLAAVWMLTRGVSRQLRYLAVELESAAEGTDPAQRGASVPDSGGLIGPAKTVLARLARAEQLVERLAQRPKSRLDARPEPRPGTAA